MHIIFRANSLSAVVEDVPGPSPFFTGITPAAGPQGSGLGLTSSSHSMAVPVLDRPPLSTPADGPAATFASNFDSRRDIHQQDRHQQQQPQLAAIFPPPAGASYETPPAIAPNTTRHTAPPSTLHSIFSSFPPPSGPAPSSTAGNIVLRGGASARSSAARYSAVPALPPLEVAAPLQPHTAAAGQDEGLGTSGSTIISNHSDAPTDVHSAGSLFGTAASHNCVSVAGMGRDPLTVDNALHASGNDYNGYVWRQA